MKDKPPLERLLARRFRQALRQRAIVASKRHPDGVRDPAVSMALVGEKGGPSSALSLVDQVLYREAAA